MYFKVFYILYFVLLSCNALTLQKITPDFVNKQFNSEINTYEVELIVSFDSSYNDTDKNLMLFIKNVIEPFDEKPFNDVYIYCKNGRHGELFRDYRSFDQYFYSCCKKTYNQSCIKNCKYTCPLPPAPTDLQFTETIKYENANNIYIKTVDNSEWKIQTVQFKYIDPYTFEGFIKKSIVWIICIILMCTYSSLFMDMINKFSNKYPFAFTISHLLFTITFIMLETIILIRNRHDNSDRGTIIKNSITFSMINIIFSLYLIYIPNKRDVCDPNAIEQRFTVKTESCKDIYSCMKNKKTKNVGTFIFFITTITQGISIFALVESIYEYFDAEIEFRCAIGILYCILSLIFFVSFITAIYDIKIPIKLNETTGQFLQILPEIIHQHKIESLGINRKVIPKNSKERTQNVGIFSEELGNFVPIATYNIQDGDILAIDDDEETPWDVLIWKIGIIKNNQIKVDDDNLVKTGCFSIKEGKIELQQCENKNNSPILVYMSYQGRLVKIGQLKNQYIYRDYNILIKFLGVILKFIPEYDDDEYNLNIVENMRTECHKLTKRLGVYYGYIYWITFFIFIIFFYIYLITDMINNLNYLSIYFYIFEFILLYVFFNFSCIVSMRLQENTNHSVRDSKIPLLENIQTRGNCDTQRSNDSSIETIDWPALIGETVNHTIDVITDEIEGVNIILIEENDNRQLEYVKNRVVIYYNKTTNLVTRIPVLE